MLIYPDSLIVQHYEVLDSTQNEANRLLLNGQLRHGMVICSDIQTQGRGRYGRLWSTEKGNLALTICLHNSPQLAWEQICYVASIAAGEAILALAPDLTLEYKWVNDLMITGKKAGGILVEALDNRWLLVGIGINLAHSPNIPKRLTTCLQHHGAKLQTSQILPLMLRFFCQYYNHWLTYGFAPIRQHWLQRAYKLGEEVSMHIPIQNATHRGIFIDIDKEGNMLLLEEQRNIVISVGEIL